MQHSADSKHRAQEEGEGMGEGSLIQCVSFSLCSDGVSGTAWQPPGSRARFLKRVSGQAPAQKSPARRNARARLLVEITERFHG